MGVTLERVQFKFASIIGELCSEPDILSQFAVWVDLRLAEYKLKGSISLDCSGDTPDPVWLNGILSALVAKRMAKMESQKQRASTSSPRSNRVTGLGRNFSERSNDADDDSLILTVSPEPVVKSEPVDSDVYPINLIEGSRENSWSRKRQSSDYSMSSPSLHKSRRLHSSSDVGMSESLMSIIGTDQEDSLQNPADHTSVTAYSDDNSSNADYMMAADISQSAQREIDRLTAQGHVSTASNIESKPGTSESTSASGQGNRTSSASTQSWRLRLNPSHRGPRTPEEVEAAKHRKAMLKRRSCVSKLERWLLIAHNETRPVETIPPEELDSLLAEFFTTLKTVRGTEYGYDSLITLRSELEQHLKHRGYPHLIRASALFARSQEAVKRRRLHQSESHLISTPQSSSSLLDEHHRTEGQLSIHIQDMTCESVQ